MPPRVANDWPSWRPPKTTPVDTLRGWHAVGRVAEQLAPVWWLAALLILLGYHCQINRRSGKTATPTRTVTIEAMADNTIGSYPRIAGVCPRCLRDADIYTKPLRGKRAWPDYLSVAMYAARSAASFRDSPISGIFGCGSSRNSAILAASKPGVCAILANGGAWSVVERR